MTKRFLFHVRLLRSAIFFFICFFASKVGISQLPATAKEPETFIITILNESASPISGRAVYISPVDWPFLEHDHGFPLLKDQKKNKIPCQIINQEDSRRNKSLFFVVDMEKNEARHYTLSWTEQPTVYDQQVRIRLNKREGKNEVLTSVSEEVFLPMMLPKLTGFQAYQTDGPSFENEKVAFRHYLDGRNSKDVFGKKVKALLPDSVGVSRAGEVTDNYHVMADWGRDILPVGTSLGLGGLGILHNGKISRLGVTQKDSVHTIKETRFKILNNGPLYGSFSIEYDEWKPGQDRHYHLKEEPAIWAGPYAYENTVKFKDLTGDEQLLIGLPKVATEKIPVQMKVNNWMVLYTYDKQTYNKEFNLGLALLVPWDLFDGWEKAPADGEVNSTYLVKLKVNNIYPVTYYAVAGWEMSDPVFKTEKGFSAYLRAMTATLDAKLNISIRKGE